MMKKFIDLHVHTNYSDGFDSIEEVLKKAIENNVGVISFTEHYNISSYKVACELAGEDIEVIPGIEIGTDMSKYSDGKKHVCHILGYYVSNDICKLLDIYELDRFNCVKSTLKLLNQNNIDISINDVLENAKDSKSIGRFDIAVTMVKMGYVKTVQEAYGKYLDHGGSSYVKRKKLSPTDLIKKIQEYGGVAVLAHPRSLRFSPQKEEQFIKELVDAGLSGIEVYNPHNSTKCRKRLLTYCKKYNLIPTVGSDYHGGKREPKVYVGYGIENNLKITDLSIISKLKERKEKKKRNKK